MNLDSIKREQQDICRKYGADLYAATPNLKIGISANVREGLLPINGLRHLPEADTTVWYIWAGEELSDDPEFFLPLHIEHIEDWCPRIVKYLGLPPGWRFLVAEDYEDVWFDESLLNAEH